MGLAIATCALPAPALAQGGAAKAVVGGGSFNNAPLLAPGTYSDTVAAGETVYWKVRLAKGQVLQVKATVDTSQIQTDALADDYDRGLAEPRLPPRHLQPAARAAQRGERWALRHRLGAAGGLTRRRCQDRHGDRSARPGLRADPGQRLRQGQVPGAGRVVRLAERRRLGPVPDQHPSRVARRSRRAGHRPAPGVLGRLRALAAGSAEAAADRADDPARPRGRPPSPPSTSPPTRR